MAPVLLQSILRENFQQNRIDGKQTKTSAYKIKFVFIVRLLGIVLITEAIVMQIVLLAHLHFLAG